MQRDQRLVDGSTELGANVAVDVETLVSLELANVVDAIAEENCCEIRDNRSKRSARPFLPPLIFFVMGASPSSARRFSNRACPNRTTERTLPRRQC